MIRLVVSSLENIIELDDKRQNHLLEYLNNIQTLVTCTGVESFIKNREGKNKIFYVKEGKVDERRFNE